MARGAHGFNASLTKGVLESLGETGVAVADQDPVVSQETVNGTGCRWQGEKGPPRIGIRAVIGA